VGHPSHHDGQRFGRFAASIAVAARRRRAPPGGWSHAECFGGPAIL